MLNKLAEEVCLWSKVEQTMEKDRFILVREKNQAYV